MNILRYDEPDFAAAIGRLCARTAFTEEVDRGVADILEGVRTEGDEAITRYARQFDQVELTPDRFRITNEELANAGSTLSAAAKEAIAVADRNVYEFSSRRRPESWTFSPRPGVTLGERFTPLRRVAAYIPGGSAPLASTVIHTATMARAAGVPEIVVTTPCGNDGRVNEAILYAAQIAGATEVYRLGGVYAIGALAFGTRSVRKVDKIVGPGNAYVTAAKRKVYGHVALDLVAGPSEVMIIADDSANPAFIAADMLAQAEHGSGRELAVLVTTSADVIDQVCHQLDVQSLSLDRADCIAQVLREGVHLILVANREQAASIADRFAPEHLEIMAADHDGIAAGIGTAGAIFLGPWTPEPIGDFVAGPSHVLPTGGAGRCFSGLTVDQFYRRSSVIQYSEAALRREAGAIAEFSAMEQLAAHGRAIGVRIAEKRTG